MRNKFIYATSLVVASLLAFDLYTIFFKLPDELNQGAVYRIIYFHVPSLLTSLTGFLVAMLASIGYLIKKDLRYDAAAAATVEVSVVFATVGLVTGSIWGRISWGIWWTWDARLTSMFVCWLLYAGYLMLRRAVDDPTQRARLSAVLAIFAFTDVIIVWKSIEWWRNQHPAPVLSIRSGGGMAPGMESPIYLNLLAIALLATVLVIIRMRQEEMRREIDALRRHAHAL